MQDFGDMVSLIGPGPAVMVAAPTAYNIVLVQPQQEVTTVWRLHQIGIELYSPIVRRQVPTGRKDRSGRKEMRVGIRPMFPGYAFLPAGADLSAVSRVKGVSGFMHKPAETPGAPNQIAALPADAVRAIRTKEYDEHIAWLYRISPKNRTPRFRAGDCVRVDVGPFADLVANIERVDGRGRVEILKGMVTISIRETDVVAA